MGRGGARAYGNRSLVAACVSADAHDVVRQDVPLLRGALLAPARPVRSADCARWRARWSAGCRALTSTPRAPWPQSDDGLVCATIDDTKYDGSFPAIMGFVNSYNAARLSKMCARACAW